MSTLTDHVAIVTGASSGIGEATALALGERGASVVLAARRADRLKSLSERIVSAGGHALAMECDVRDQAQCAALVERAMGTWGKVDALINNAGVMLNSTMDQCRVEDWDTMVDVNVKGLLYCTAAALPHMLKADAGHIVNVSSIAGRWVFPTAAVYCGTKHFVHAMSDGLRQEIAQAGKHVRVTLISPGIVATELQDHIPDKEIQARIRERTAAMDPLKSADVAGMIIYALESPPHVGINEIITRPTEQP